MSTDPMRSFSPTIRACPDCGRALAADGMCLPCALGAGLAEEPEEVETPPASDASGQRVGPYELIEEIARGGMGIVYRARQRGPNRLVALKMILPARLGAPGVFSRFRAEAEAVARLDHPGVLPIYEVGEHGGMPFFSMKLVEGGSLQTRLGAFRGKPRAVATLLAQVARAVHHAHQRGVLHRDLKPGNILFDLAGRPFVSDFGLAKELAFSVDGDGGDSERALTQTASALGTPYYMAPEQAAGSARALTTAADIYSLGAILYELLLGVPPFTGSSALEVLRAAAERPAPGLRAKDATIPRDLETICRKCLEKTPAARYGSAEALAEDLERFLDGRPIRARPVGTAEQLWRWARRNPLPAALAASLALTLIGVSAGSTLAAVRIHTARDRALHAERDALEKLRASYLAQARAARRSDRAGRRFDSLAVLAFAARTRPSLELRNEAVASLALADLRELRRWRISPADRPFTTVGFGPALDCYACAPEPGVVSLRRVGDNSEIARLPPPAADARIEAFFPFSDDGRFLAARWRDGGDLPMICVWDVTQRTLAFQSPGAGLAFLSGADARAMVHGSAKADPARVLSVPLTGSTMGQPVAWRAPRAVAHLAGDPAGGRLAAALEDPPGIAIFAAADGDGPILSSWSLPSPATHLAWSQDGQSLAVSALDHRITLFDARTGERRAALLGHFERPTQAGFAGRDAFLVSTAWDLSVRLWDPAEGRQLACTITAGVNQDLRLSADRQRMAFSLVNGEAALVEIAPSPVLRALRPALGAAAENAPLAADDSANRRYACAFSPDGRLLATAGVAGLQLWDTATGRDLGAVPLPDAGHGEKGLAFSHDGGSVYASTESVGVLRWPVRRAAAEGEIHLGPMEVIYAGRGLRLSDLSADGRWLAVTCPSLGETRLVSLAAGADGEPREMRKLADRRGMVSARFGGDPSGDGWIVTCGWPGDGQARVWNLADGQLLRTLETGPKTGLAVSHDGRRLLTGSPGGYRFWETQNWQTTATYPHDLEGFQFSCAHFSPDGTLAAVQQSSDRIALLDAATGAELLTLEPPAPFGFIQMRFSPDGGTLAAVGVGGVVQLWDLRALRRQLSEVGLDW